MFRPCLLVPTYNNAGTIGAVLDRLAPAGCDCLMVDDGSDEPTRALLIAEAAARDSVHLKRRERNGGKGAAVKTGLLWAHELGYSHALQIDADGQHRAEDAPHFLAAAKANPGALVLGKPVFGADVPASRRYGRLLSVALVRLETLSGAIRDPLFGFRVYPVAACAALIERQPMGDRMDFDPEIAVRLVWDGLPVHTVPTPVFYPEGGVSHFRMLGDNLLMTWLHARLLAGALFRLPRLVFRRGRR